jgi:hypothetical protein
MKRAWKKYLLYGSAIIVGGVLIFMLIRWILLGYTVAWTGFGDYTLPNSNFIRGKTLWDWMELLVIPAFLAGGAFFLNRSERNTERHLADDRAKLEREIAIDRQREDALQGYLDRMEELLLEKKLLTTRDTKVRNVARVRTLTTLAGLDANRKGALITFLYQAGLIVGDKPVISLDGANLSSANLYFAELYNADLSGANLNDANLEGANLSGANLSCTHLKHANMWDTNLVGANLSVAELSSADLFDANLSFAVLKNAIMFETNLGNSILDNAVLDGALMDGATMPDGTKHD